MRLQDFLPSFVMVTIAPLCLIMGAGMFSAAPVHAVSPGTNGKIAYNEGDWSHCGWLYLVNPDGSDKLRAPFNGLEPVWSPDGSKVAYYRSDGYLRVAHVDGSHEVTLTRGEQPTWSPDGTKLAFSRGEYALGSLLDRNLFVIDVATKQETQLTDDGVSNDAMEISNSAPAWNPDPAAHRIAYWRREAHAGGVYLDGIWTMRDDGGDAAPLVQTEKSWGALLEVEWQGPDWSPDGTALVVEELLQGPDRNVDVHWIATVSWPGGTVTLLSPPHTPQEDDYYPAWSPDGTKIAFLSSRGFADPHILHLWVMDADGGEAHQVTDRSACFPPSWQLPASNLVVNSTMDMHDQTAGDGHCDTGGKTASGDPECTLRAAIEEANANPGKDTITFEVPGSAVPSIRIFIWKELEVTDPVVIDGTTQPGSGRVELQWTATDCSVAEGLWPSGLVIRAGDSTVRGLAISRFCGYGIVLTEGSGNVLEGNFVGTDVTGMQAVGNGYLTYDYGPTGGGILVQSSGNRIGGTDHDVGVCNRACNLISGNSLVDRADRPPTQGILIYGAAATGNRVFGNFIGTDITGERPPSGGMPQELGVAIEGGAQHNTIGGTTAGMRNLIAANLRTQIAVDASANAASGENTIAGNFVGTDASGTDRSISDQDNGIFIYSMNNQVAGNVIGGFTTYGVYVGGVNAAENVLSGNLIGIGSDGITALRNGDGVRIESGATATTLSGNTMAFASGAGVFVAPGTDTTLIDGNAIHHNVVGVQVFEAPHATLSDNTIHHNELGVWVEFASGLRISANAIHDNVSTRHSGLGIDLAPDGVTLNDFGDIDAGPNGLQNFPTLGFAAVRSGGGVRVGGSLDTTLGSHIYRIELFANAACDPSGYGEGERFLGFVDVATDFSGRAVIDSTLAPAGVSTGQFITVTATDSNGYTSEFSRCVEAQPGTDLAGRALSGATALGVAGTSGLAVGDQIVICPGCPTEERNVVAGFGSLVLVHPLQFDHEVGEPVVKIATTLDPFMAYAVATTKATPKLAPLGPVTLADRYGSAGYNVLKLAPLHAPADTNGEGTRDAVTHLLGYGVKPVKGTLPFSKRRDVRVVNQCSDTFVQVKKPVGLLVPTAKSLTDPVVAPDPGTHERDHFLCYAAAAQSKRSDGMPLPKLPKGMQVDVADQFQTRRYDLKALTRFCQPVAKSGSPVVLKGSNAGTPVVLEPTTIRHPFDVLVCYQAKLATKEIAQSGCDPANPADKGTTIVPKPPKHTPQRVYVANQLGTLRLDTKKELELCLPSTSPEPGVPSN